MEAPKQQQGSHSDPASPEPEREAPKLPHYTRTDTPAHAAVHPSATPPTAELHGLHPSLGFIKVSERDEEDEEGEGKAVPSDQAHNLTCYEDVSAAEENAATVCAWLRRFLCCPGVKVVS